MDCGFWILDSGFWILDFGFWILFLHLLAMHASSAYTSLDLASISASGFWILDFWILVLEFKGLTVHSTWSPELRFEWSKFHAKRTKSRPVSTTSKFVPPCAVDLAAPSTSPRRRPRRAVDLATPSTSPYIPQAPLYSRHPSNRGRRII